MGWWSLSNLVLRCICVIFHLNTVYYHSVTSPCSRKWARYSLLPPSAWSSENWREETTLVRHAACPQSDVCSHLRRIPSKISASVTLSQKSLLPIKFLNPSHWRRTFSNSPKKKGLKPKETPPRWTAVWKSPAHNPEATTEFIFIIY